MSEFLSAEMAGLASRLEMIEEDIRRNRRDRDAKQKEAKTEDAFMAMRTEVTTLRMNLETLQKTVLQIGKQIQRINATVETMADEMQPA